jgi:hypothetical protein
MDAKKLKLIITLAVALFAALYLGIAAATAQMEAVLWIVGGAGLTVCLALGRRIWLLLPFMTSLGLVLPISGNFSSMLLAQAMVLGFSTALFLMRKLPLRFHFTELEFWCILFLLCLAQVYIRNPVGLNIFGGAMVGGKPYVMLAITIAAAYLISILKVPPKELKWYVTAVMVGSWINFSLGAVAKISPGIGQYLGASFATDVDKDQGLADRDAADEDAASRVSFVRGISLDLSNWISSRIPPLKASFLPLWSPLVFFTLVAAAYSGFRSQLAAVGLTYVVGILYRGGIRHLIIACFLIASALAALALVNLVAPLPPNIQRALTFLPGTWEERYKKDTKESTEWRVQMWVDALSSDRYIKNRILGDGLGMTAEQHAQAISLSTSTSMGAGGLDATRETMMIAGDYHSGPVQTIRVVGYVGLVVLWIGLIRIAILMHHQIQRCRNTEWYSTALFLGNTYIWFVFGWTFIFGSFTGGASALFMGSALIRLLQNNLPLPAYASARREPYLLRTNQRNSPREATLRN